jgi:hypothetical protein
MGRKKLNMVRFSVTAPETVKDIIDRLSEQNGRSLAVEAGRMLEETLRQRGLLPTENQPATERPSD